ncbi:putative mRNA capping enzyme, beta chain [Blattamonas nauphoetae]|uniref:mRNA 5'-phosphatase n=1 Tax=Blattamonas nauphoetae TaxID=2049346 RepID=A0ABQ9XTC1_9EUKA|nr:putative mRNA capping enzyme, beta chain [Blattamonas nauphoetae]
MAGIARPQQADVVPYYLSQATDLIAPAVGPNDLLNHLTRYLVSSYQQEVEDASFELEIRLGRIIHSTSLRRYTSPCLSDAFIRMPQDHKFESSLPAKAFNHLRSFLLSRRFLYEESTTLDLIHADGRITVSAEDPRLTLACIRKSKKQTKLNMVCPESKFDLRVSSSWEINEAPYEVVQSPLLQQRLKKRISFILPAFRIDLTEVMTRDGNSFTAEFQHPDYECEIEISDTDLLKKYLTQYLLGKHHQLEQFLMVFLTNAQILRTICTDFMNRP